MKYKKNKLRLNEIVSVMQGFYFLVKFGYVFIYILEVYRKKSSSFLLRKNFCFETHILSPVLKDFSVENLETTPSTFLSKFSFEIYLSRIINFWGSIFTVYLMWGTFSLVCALSVFLFFLTSVFFFYRFFSLTDTNVS